MFTYLLTKASLSGLLTFRSSPPGSAVVQAAVHAVLRAAVDQTSR